MKRSKYGNRKVKLDGYTFDSQSEARRYQDLQLLERAGEITGLRVHPEYILVEAYKRRNGKRIRAAYYTADFEYLENGITVVEDVKGVQTAVFRLKRKLFEYRYRDVDFRIVDA